MSLALYRKYRPARFADVIGQDQVTIPLMRALDNDRIHHAYLFTGPRGCGKTSSARIMARSMNCVNGPTSAPCEVCQSCIELAPNGPGSIDVIEIDAATYRGIEDAKELRERAVYAPAVARYKIYIIDEAHQLTRDAFNVLLKLVEEPPPHLRFIFATTEPDKIIPTLRSRTHHYPFRLVSAKVLQEHLALMCEREGISAEAAALALVARAGAGSVRDSQSILGQVIAGSGSDGITYASVVAQLGFTDEVLLSRVVDAIAKGDGAALFTLIDEVVTSGHEPRRFAHDLLERLRDLVVVVQVPDAGASGLFDLPAEQIADLEVQAKLFTPAQLIRVADLVSAGLSELRGAASPRLQLELLAARLVTSEVTQDLADRVALLEQGGQVQSVRPSVQREKHAATKIAEQTTSTTSSTQNETAPDAHAPSTVSIATTARVASSAPPPMKPSQVTKLAAQTSVPTEVPQLSVPTNITIDHVKKSWPTVISALQKIKRVAHVLFVDSVPLSISPDGVLAVACSSVNNVQGAVKNGHDVYLRQAIEQVVGVPLKLELQVDAQVTKQAKPDADVADSGDADPDDENVTPQSAVDMVTEILGGKIIDQGPANS